MATTIRGRTNRRLFILPCSNFELLGVGGYEAALAWRKSDAASENSDVFISVPRQLHTNTHAHCIQKLYWRHHTAGFF